MDTLITEKDVTIAIWTELCDPGCVRYQVTCPQSRLLKAGAYSWTNDVPAGAVVDELSIAIHRTIEKYVEEINGGTYSELDNTTLQ